jgi:hypothetical protein
MMCGRDNPSNEHYGVRELRTYNNTFCLFRQHKSRRTPHYFLYCYQPCKAPIHLRTFVQRHAQIPPRSRRLPKAILRQVNRIPRNHGRGQNNRLYIFRGFLVVLALFFLFRPDKQQETSSAQVDGHHSDIELQGRCQHLAGDPRLETTEVERQPSNGNDGTVTVPHTVLSAIMRRNEAA